MIRNFNIFHIDNYGGVSFLTSCFAVDGNEEDVLAAYSQSEIAHDCPLVPNGVYYIQECYGDSTPFNRNGATAIFRWVPEPVRAPFKAVPVSL